jgi:hypothetical protein
MFGDQRPCSLWVDAVEKRICSSERARLIQDQAPTRIVDSKIHSPRFDCCAFLFYSLSTATFSTVSVISGLGEASSTCPLLPQAVTATNPLRPRSRRVALGGPSAGDASAPRDIGERRVAIRAAVIAGSRATKARGGRLRRFVLQGPRSFRVQCRFRPDARRFEQDRAQPNVRGLGGLLGTLNGEVAVFLRGCHYCTSHEQTGGSRYGSKATGRHRQSGRTSLKASPPAPSTLAIRFGCQLALQVAALRTLVRYQPRIARPWLDCHHFVHSGTAFWTSRAVLFPHVRHDTYPRGAGLPARCIPPPRQRANGRLSFSARSRSREQVAHRHGLPAPARAWPEGRFARIAA